MVTKTKIQITRTALLAILIVGLALGIFGLMVGIGLPGLILSVIGWIAFIIAVVWLIVRALNSPAGPFQATPWRPGDKD